MEIKVAVKRRLTMIVDRIRPIYKLMLARKNHDHAVDLDIRIVLTVDRAVGAIQNRRLYQSRREDHVAVVHQKHQQDLRAVHSVAVNLNLQQDQNHQQDLQAVLENQVHAIVVTHIHQ